MKEETTLQDLSVIDPTAEEIRGGVTQPAPALRPPPPKLPPDPPPPPTFK